MGNIKAIRSVIAGLVIAAAPGVAAHAEGAWNFGDSRVGGVHAASLDATCRGTLIGADLVLTAAHCIVAIGGSLPVDPASVTFSIAGKDGVVAVHQVSDIATDPEFFREEGAPTRAFIARDIALLRLETIEKGPFDSMAPFDLNKSHIALLPVSEGAVFLAEPCKAQYEANNIVLLSCARMKGTSGSPGYALVNGERRVVAVISATGTQDNAPITFAVNPMGLLSSLKWYATDLARPESY